MLNPPSKHLIKLSNEEYTRYSKQLILENIGLEGQKRLKKAKVLVIGAGGLGCPAMIYLIISGIGCIGIIDQDIVESSNLNRQILYSKQDITKFKVSSAKQKLEEINNDCIIIEHNYNLNNQNSLEIISYYDVIIDTTDNFKIRYMIDQTCFQLNKIHVYGAIDKFEGQIGIFNYKSGIRYENLYPPKSILENRTCNISGIMGITSGYIGILQATETIKIILGLNKKCKNFILLCNILNMRIKEKKIYTKKYNLGEIKKTNTKIKQNEKISKKQLKFFEDKTLIVDIRKENEFQNKHIKQSINIPLIKFKFYKTMRFLLSNTNKRILIIYCETMERSIIASYFLKNYNIKHHIIKKNTEVIKRIY